MTPLLSSTGELTAAETLTAEGTLLGTEAATSATLGPETLGLSIVIGALVIAGTSVLIWWLNSDNSDAVQHESHNQYNEIEKYYKFLAHDQLKLSIDAIEWLKIAHLYQENQNDYPTFLKEVKKIFTSFAKADHSGWGGAITDTDIDILVKVLFNHFHKIDDSFFTNSIHGWKIVTNTIGSYFTIEAE